MENYFDETINSLFCKNNLPYHLLTDPSGFSFIEDDMGTKLYTIPVLEKEERYMEADNAHCYLYLSIIDCNERTDVIRISTNNIWKSNTYLSKFGSKPFVNFSQNTWNVFFDVIKVMLTEISQYVIYTYSGWADEFNKYLLGTVSITEDSINEIESTVCKSKIILSDLDSGERERGINEIFSQLTGNPFIGYTMLLYLILGVLKPRFVLKIREGPEFVLCIIGTTGSRKTSSTIAAFNTVNSSLASFEDTLASIRRSFQANKSGVLIIDDFKSASIKNNEKFEQITRLCGDVSTVGRYVSAGRVVDEPNTGLAVITGERRPELQNSSYSRILFLDLDSNPINLSVLTRLQNSKAELNSFLVSVIQTVIKTPDFDRNFVDKVVNYRDSFMREEAYSGMHGRYYGIYSWLAASWDFMIELFGFTPEVDYKYELKKFIFAQHEFYCNDPILLFKKAYRELTDSNEIIVVSDCIPEDLNFDVVESEERIFIRSNSVYKKAVSFWKEQGIDFPCSEKKLRQELYDAGVLIIQDGKFTKERKTRENRSYSGYFLRKYLFYSYKEDAEKDS